MSTSQMILNSEKAELARYILSIDSEELICRVKRNLAGLVTTATGSPKPKTDYVLSQIAGQWEDDRTADAMVSDIYSHRKLQTAENYQNPFDL